MHIRFEAITLVHSTSNGIRSGGSAVFRLVLVPFCSMRSHCMRSFWGYAYIHIDACAFVYAAMKTMMTMMTMMIVAHFTMLILRVKRIQNAACWIHKTQQTAVVDVGACQLICTMCVCNACEWVCDYCACKGVQRLFTCKARRLTACPFTVESNAWDAAPGLSLIEHAFGCMTVQRVVQLNGLVVKIHWSHFSVSVQVCSSQHLSTCSMWAHVAVVYPMLATRTVHAVNDCCWSFLNDHDHHRHHHCKINDAASM